MTFASKDGSKHIGVAVALKWLIAFMNKVGKASPAEERVKQELKHLAIGEAGQKRQHFNKYPDGQEIKRGESVVETIPRACVMVKLSAFSKEDWKMFTIGNYTFMKTVKYNYAVVKRMAGLG